MDLFLKVKSDPQAYKEDVMMIKQQLVTILRFAIKTQSGNSGLEDEDRVKELITFVNNVSTYYRKDLQDSGELLCEILEKKPGVLTLKVKRELVFCIIKMKNVGILDKKKVIELLFRTMMKVPRALRLEIREAIMSHISKDSSQEVHHLTLRLIEETVLKINDSNEKEFRSEEATDSYMALSILFDLYRKRVWLDEKSINVAARACFCKCLKTSNLAIMMFNRNLSELVDDDEEREKEKAENEAIAESKKQMHSKKTRARKRRMKKIEKISAARDREANEGFEIEDEMKRGVFRGAIELVHDPQAFAEELLATMKKSNRRIEDKVYGFGLIAKLISNFQLVVPSFYSHLERYINPHIRYVSRFLSIISTACHEYVPGEIIDNLLRVISHNFVSDRCRPEFVTIGLNTIREICLRNPSGMTSTHLSDLILYKKNKDKGVVAAARSLIALFRKVNPELLPKKERGRPEDRNPENIEDEEMEIEFDEYEEEDDERDGDMEYASDEEGNETGDGSDAEIGMDSAAVNTYDDYNLEEHVGVEVTPDDIEMGLRAQKEQRILEKKIHGANRKVKTGGLSNEEKRKKKNFMMVRKGNAMKEIIRKRKIRKKFPVSKRHRRT